MTRDELLLVVSQYLNKAVDNKSLSHINSIVFNMEQQLINKGHISQYELDCIEVDEEDPTKVIIKIK